MIDRVTEYAESVVRREVCCGDLHRLACQRHLDDLAKSKGDWPFYWAPAASERILNFAETLKVIEGFRVEPVSLIPSQIFDIGATFGWKKKDDGYRRFRRRYKSVARQNGKSFENGIMATYIAGFSGYRYGKLFTAATKKRQARIAWEEVKKFVQADDDLNALFKIQDYKSLITAINTACTIEALSKESGLDDGFRPIFASLDELHQMSSNATYKALLNGTRTLPETLISMITTRGKTGNSFCREMDDYAIQVLKGTQTADDFFVDIYCLDKGDDIWNESNWIKANPYVCSNSDFLEVFRNTAATAKAMQGADLQDFVCKSLNMWVKNTDAQAFDPDKWKACGSARTLDDIASLGFKDCWVGIDLSQGGDLTTLALEFAIENERLYVYSHSFMPRGRLEEHIGTDIAPYDLWEQEGLVTVTGGENDFMNDYKFIISHLRELKQRYNLNYLGIGIDPHNAAGVLQDLEGLAPFVMTITQSARSLNDATCALQLLIKSEKVEYDKNNELLTWSMVNASVTRNSFGEIKIDKKPGAKYKRIDPCDALIDAHVLLTQKINEQRQDVNAEMDEYFKIMGWNQ